MTLSRLCAKCANCPKVDTCDHKRMEMVGSLEPTSVTANSEVANSVIVPHKYRQVKVAPGTIVTIDLEDIKKEIEQSIAKQAGLYGDFFKSCT